MTHTPRTMCEDCEKLHDLSVLLKDLGESAEAKELSEIACRYSVVIKCIQLGLIHLAKEDENAV